MKVYPSVTLVSFNKDLFKFLKLQKYFVAPARFLKKKPSAEKLWFGNVFIESQGILIRESQREFYK